MSSWAPVLIWLGSRRAIAGEFLVLVMVGLIPVLSHGVAWLGNWKLALDAGTFGMTLVGPLAAGIACAVYVRLSQANMDRITLTASRPVGVWLCPAAGTWLLAALAVMLICVGTTVAASLAGSRATPTNYWVLAPTLAVLAAHVAIGVALGAIGRRTWLVPVAAVTAFGLGILAAVGVAPDVLRVGGTSGTMIGTDFAAGPIIAQGVVAAGIAAALLGLSHREALRLSRVAKWCVPVVAVAGLVAYPQLPADSDQRYTAAQDVAYVCAGEAPSVCLEQDTTRPLDDLSTRVQRLAAPLREVDAALPTRFVQLLPSRAIEAGAGYIALNGSAELASKVTDEDAVSVLVRPAMCPQYVADVAPPESLFDVRLLLGRWLLSQAGSLRPSEDAPDATWLAADLSTQGPWVRSVYKQLRECEIDALRLPPGIG